MEEIKLLKSVAGRDFNGKPFSFKKGEVVNVSRELAVDLCQSSNAEKVVAKKKATKTSNHNQQSKKRNSLTNGMES